MEDKKANIIATITILSLIIVIIAARVYLKLSTTFHLIAGVDISLILAVIFFLVIRNRYNRERKNLESRYISEGRELRIEYSFLRKVAGVPTKFKLDDLEEATDGFRLQIGKGGSGSVFKGVLKDGSQVAVKRIEGEEKGEKEFRSEVAAIASVQHKNLVRLYGYSSVNRYRYLVYEYIPNSSLDVWIFPDRGGSRKLRGCLTWDQRYQVAIDVAKALSYLHNDCRAKILHLDVKPENILLDEDYRAVVTDFGLSKLVARDESKVVTEIRGTCGYLAPEWILEQGISEKSDVYSYGIVLLEMIGGRRSVLRVESKIKNKKKKLEYFPKIVNQKMRERRVMEIVDHRLVEAKDVDDEGQVMKLVCVALWCIQEKAKNRPDMAMVVEMLEGRVPVNEPPDSRLVVVDLLAAGGDDEDVDDVTTGVRRVVEIPKLHIQKERHFRFPSVCSSIISPVSPR